MGSSPTGHPTKKSADALHRRIFLFGGRAQWGSNKAALTRQRQSNQQPSGLLVSLRVPISRNVYQDKCCADALHRRIFLFGGVLSGARTARHCRRQGNQQPGGLLISARVPISRNVYQDKCCADVLHRRIFLFGGVPGGTLPPRHYFLLKSMCRPFGELWFPGVCTCFFVQRFFFIAVSASSAAGSARSLHWNSHPCAAHC